MNITIKATNHGLTDETRSWVEEKFAGLDKYVHENEPASLHADIEESMEVVRSGYKFRVAGDLSIDGRRYHAEGKGDTLEGAIDKVRDELSREVHKSRGRARRFVRKGGAAIKNMLRFGR